MNLISENTNIGDSRSISISPDFIENGSGGNNCTFLPLDAELLPKYPRFGKKIPWNHFHENREIDFKEAKFICY